MALKFTIPFPLLSPANPNPSDHRSSTEVRFSRWNNANAQKIILQERAQKEIEDEIRFHRRFSSADRITEIQSDDGPTPTEDDAPRFKSTGTPSSPSRPSIPGKVSKYSKPPKPDNPHPAFRSVIKTRKLPRPPDEAAAEKRREARINVSENGLSYVIPGAPFEFQYSYTEAPKVKPLKLREAPYTPFGPSTMSRPWTGRAPLPPSKKKLKEFDSFRPPPPNKKGVKPVQAPGPFLRGSGPRYVMSKEEILGEPLTREEIKDLILQCIKTKRQLNIGRDGLTHNMLDNIHAHWKRRRVCKIKCKGVCTVDMGNVRQQLEERTGGKIISCKGGVIYLFRGRNYNYKTRPRFPLMLWKPVTPVYPRLVKQAPDGLTHEEADEIRKMGRQLTPIRKLGKNGVYCNLVRNVREAFEECEVVRINCQGLNSSDFHKIGAKLRDLVPCVLISFEREHILIWRGREWNSSLERPGDGDKEAKVSETGTLPVSEGQPLQDPEVSSNPVNPDMAATSASIPSTSSESPGMLRIDEAELDEMGCDDDSRATTTGFPWKTVPASGDSDEDDGIPEINGRKPATLSTAMERVETLLKQALEGGSAVMLHRDCLDADIVYARAVNLAKSAPPEPVYPRQPKNKAVKRFEKKDTDDLEVEETAMEPEMKESWREESWRGSLKTKGKMDFRDDYLGVVPQGSLAVDELAKLLA